MTNETTPTAPAGPVGNEAAERLRHGCDEWHARGNVACDCYCHRAPGTIYCDRHAECTGLDPFRHPNQRTVTLAEHDRAERRATVERITKRLQPLALEVSADTTSGRWRDGAQYAISEFHAILDEEAAR